MTFTSRLIESIGKPEAITIQQSFSYYKAVGCFQDLSLNEGSFAYLKDVFSCLKIIDESFTVEIKNGDNDTVLFSSNNDADAITEKCRRLIESFEADESTSFKVEWSKKESENNRILIFDVVSFIDFLSSKPLAYTLEEVSRRFNYQNIQFYCFEDLNDFSNGYFNFINVGSDAQDLSKFNNRLDQPNFQVDLYNEKVELRNKAGHFFNAETLRFIPEHFIFDAKINDIRWRNIFERWETIFYLVYLSDYSSIKDDIVSFKIKGYKTLNCTSDGKVPNNVIEELRQIYQWAYSEGPFIDKIGIARNVLSIHIVNDDIRTLEIGTCASAQSGYDLYLKDNVKQYIEVKNKIADMLHSQSEKSSAIVKDMFNMFKTSMWTFVTFFITVFLFRSSLNSSGDKGSAVFGIGIALIIFSFLYILFARKEVEDELQRLISKYNEISNRYKDLLNEADLEKILRPSNGSSSEQIEIDYINKKKKQYTRYWSSINALITMVWLCIFSSEMIKITNKLYDFFSPIFFGIKSYFF
ncbi:hypothetical protein WMO13_06625 [Ignatzschineria larvae DSM 13226]|uniref:Uncharacterized protein n=1 Tax=Ignatzschineria larvae DSM 13226 TaxID=1111732 RepID=A0ABZ3BX20_9GAMM|nr:hypothetical protein [Ignatzschineria larvae]